MPDTYEQRIAQQTTSAPTQQIPTNADMFGARTGKTLQNLGQAGQQYARNKQIEAQQTYDAFISDKVNEFRSIVREGHYNPQMGILTKKGGDAIGAGEQSELYISQEYKTFTKGMNSIQKRDFDTKIAPTAESYMKASQKHALKQRNAYVTDQATNQIDNAIQDSLLNTDDATAQRNTLNAIVSNVKNLASVKGMSDDEAETLLRDKFTDYHLAHAQSIAASSPNDAIAYLNKHKGVVDESKRLKANATLERESRARTRQAERDRRAYEKQIETAIRLEDTAWRVRGEGAPMNPHNNEDRKNLEEWIDHAEVGIASQIDIARTTNILPKQTSTILEGILYNGSASEKIEAANMLTSLLETNPLLRTGFNSQSMAYAEELRTQSAGNPLPDLVVERAENINRPSTKDEISFRASLVDTRARKSMSFDANKGLYQNWIPFDDITVPDYVKAEHESRAENYMVNRGMSQGAAVGLAAKEIKSEYNVTKVGSVKRFTKLPMEAVYAVEGVDVDNAKWINEQLISEIKNSTPAAIHETIEGSLIYDLDSKAYQRGLIQYKLFYQDDEGQLLPVPTAQGGMMTFMPEWETSPEYMRRTQSGKPVAPTDQSADNVTRAKALRDIRQNPLAGGVK